MELLIGLGLLVLVLALFSLFSFKAPNGSKALSGLAHAAVASFLVEAIFVYVLGKFAGIEFFEHVGEAAGSMGGPAAAGLVLLALGANPLIAITVAISVTGQNILAGFIAGYAISFIANKFKEHLPTGIDEIVGPLVVAPIAYFIASTTAPGINAILHTIGSAIEVAASSSPYVMGFLLGGIMKVLCSSPLSAMALTAILGLTGLPMGIASIACVGGAITDGIVLKRLKLADKGAVAAVMIEPLTQAHIISRYATRIYPCNFIGGALSGLVAVYFGIISNAPGTAAPVPGLLAPFGFNPPLTVLAALIGAIACGALAGYIGTSLYLMKDKKEKDSHAIPVTA